MIFLAFYLIYSLCLLAVLGLISGKIFGQLFSVPFFFEDIGVVNTLLLGIVTLTTILSCVSLVLPVNGLVHALLLLALLGWVAWNRTYVAKAAGHVYQQLLPNKGWLAAGIFCLMAGIVFASGPVKVYDTGLYHAQAVKWINAYGVVPGLGNLHFRLAFNSAWLVFSSFFDILLFDGKSYHLVNLIVFAVGVMICLRGLADLTKGRVKISSLVSSLLMLFLIARYRELASLSTDFPATSFLFFALILLVQTVEARLGSEESAPRGPAGQSFYLVVLFSAFAITVKLSVAPVVLFPLLLFVLMRQKRIPLLLASAALGLVVLLPFLLRNLILSGYLVFPFPGIDWFNFDWKVPAQNALSIKEQTKFLVYTAEFNDPITRTVGFAEWLRNWFEIHIRGNLELTFYLLISPLLVAPFLYVCLGGGRFRRNFPLLLIQGLLGVGVLFWLASGPEPRLGAGWILSFAIFPLAVVLQFALELSVRNGRKHHNILAYGMLLIFCLWLGQASGFRARLIGEDAYLIWTIEPLPEPELQLVETAAGLQLYVPVAGDQAWDGALPGTPYVNDNLELRGDSMVDGFRIRRQ